MARVSASGRAVRHLRMSFAGWQLWRWRNARGRLVDVGRPRRGIKAWRLERLPRCLLPGVGTTRSDHRPLSRPGCRQMSKFPGRRCRRCRALEAYQSRRHALSITVRWWMIWSGVSVSRWWPIWVAPVAQILGSSLQAGGFSAGVCVWGRYGQGCRPAGVGGGRFLAPFQALEQVGTGAARGG
jgi:hypothetical protein